jgi:hypothetical protein
MTSRVKLWLGASALALASGALPAAPILSPITTGLLGIDPAGQAWAQEAGDESGEGAASECTDDGDEEGGSSECPTDGTSSGEDGEGEGG